MFLRAVVVRGVPHEAAGLAAGWAWENFIATRPSVGAHTISALSAEVRFTSQLQVIADLTQAPPARPRQPSRLVDFQFRG